MDKERRDLLELEGSEIILRFADHGVSGTLAGVQQFPWGLVLHLVSRVGEHYVPFPGRVQQVVLPRRE
jgi:hypothetical protein